MRYQLGPSASERIGECRMEVRQLHRTVEELTACVEAGVVSYADAWAIYEMLVVRVYEVRRAGFACQGRRLRRQRAVDTWGSRGAELALLATAGAVSACHHYLHRFEDMHVVF